ncbi:MAG: hypothetical protein JSS69_13530 [Acidobacteria bacterium]|nr:hypothetical protein [Acidobacteriota bacterium]MBS1866930.1 hypothetical protein [Acidobacteriota bacterium]
MWLSRALSWTVCVSMVLPNAVPGAEQPPLPQSLPKTVAVAAFKNGLAFVVRQGAVQLQSGTGRITPIPNATLGTLWLAPGEANTSLDEVVAYRYNVSAERPIQSIAEVLQANAGKTVTITYSMNMKDYTGEIVGVREWKPSPEDSGAEGSPMQPVVSAKPQYLLLRVDKKLLAFPIGSIANAVLPDDTNFQEKVEQQRTALRFKIKGAGEKTDLTMGYLEHGLGWTPSYMISLADDKTAQITMQAVVMDDAEDLNNTDVFFVVGVPNFAYSETPSPMSLQQNLLSFMKDAGRRDGDNYRMYSNAIAGQMIGAEYKELDANNEPSFAQTVTELSGSPEEDLFLYSRTGVTLARGERATYNVFSSTVGYEHIYEWEVVDPQRVDAYGNVVPYNPNSPDATAKNSIWHSIRLKNTTKFPWTSAPTMVISGTKPVSQDTLPYTPKAATSNLKITIATDIRSSHEEREVARQQNVQRRHGYEFDLVTVEGTMKLKNYKSKEVKVNIDKTLRGEVETLSDTGKAVKLGEAIQTDNPLSRLTWEIPLKAGEERVVTYRYKIFVRG